MKFGRRKRVYRVRKTKEYTPEHMGITVRFRELPGPREQGIFREMIEAWGTVGIMGGFGGVTHGADSVQFDEEDQLAEWMADVGGDNDAALEVLLNLLDQFGYEFAAIEEVILGTYIQE